VTPSGLSWPVLGRTLPLPLPLAWCIKFTQLYCVLLEMVLEKMGLIMIQFVPLSKHAVTVYRALCECCVGICRWLFCIDLNRRLELTSKKFAAGVNCFVNSSPRVKHVLLVTSCHVTRYFIICLQTRMKCVDRYEQRRV